jgi:hypothetical protein
LLVSLEQIALQRQVALLEQLVVLAFQAVLLQRQQLQAVLHIQVALQHR